MFEALVYLFENYFEGDIRPDRYSLARELCAAGFDETDIEDALGWFGAFDLLSSQASSPSRGVRIYSEMEIKKLGSDGLSFLMLQEQLGALDGFQREFIVDRVMALSTEHVPAAAVRHITRMVLQAQSQTARPRAEGALLQHSNSTLH